MVTYIIKKTLLFLGLWSGLLWSANAWSQSTVTAEKTSVEERMAKARAAKADKKAAKAAGTWIEREKATSVDYKTPAEKQLKGPHGEVVHTGERGAKYYINKNGNKTYLSSNQ